MKNSRMSGNYDHMAIDSRRRQTTFGEELYASRLSSTSDASPGSYRDRRPPPFPDSLSPYNGCSGSLTDQSPPFFALSGDLSSSPLSKSPWSSHRAPDPYAYTGLMGSLVREEGHIYSLAASGDLLYTGSESKNIRVWKNQKEFSGFKSNSGLVKAIIISDDRIYTGHQDGKIRVWKVSGKDPSLHKRIGTLPTLKAKMKSSFNPNNYVEVSKNKNAIWIKHTDAISSLSLNEDKTLLYSASWDKTIKVWRVSDSKCLESISAHDDAVNSVAAGFDGLVFTGSADGTVKAWRREFQVKGTKHYLSQTLLKKECAVTALAIDPSASFLYCASSDGLINFWERDKVLSHGGVLKGHKLAILCLMTAGNLIFSGSADTNICVWRREEREHSCLLILSGHSGPVKCLAVEEDKTTTMATTNGVDRQYMVYSGSLDKSVKIWRVSGQPAAAMVGQPPPSPPSSLLQHFQMESNSKTSCHQRFHSDQSFASSQGSSMSRVMNQRRNY